MLYAKTSQQMLFDLINASNPSLPIPIAATNVKFGTPTTITPGGNIQDTSIKVIALPNAPYVGNQQLTYRRLNATALFRSVPLRIDLYSAASAGSTPYKMSQLLPYINAKYGLNIQASDIQDVNFPAGNTNANPAYGVPAGTRNAVATLTWTTNNYAWQGNINVCWVQAPQDLSTLLAVSSLEQALTYPGKRDVVDNTVYVPNLDTYSVDFTDALATAVNGGSPLTPSTIYGGQGVAVSNASTYTQIIAALNAANLAGNTYTNTGPATNKFDLTGALYYGNIDMTQAANQALYPEADYRYFNRLIVIKLQSGNTWGAGDIFMHYNV